MLVDPMVGAYGPDGKMVCHDCMTDDEGAEANAAVPGDWTPVYPSDNWGFDPCCRCGKFPRDQ